MPNCFSLSRKGKESDGLLRLITVDEEICQHFNVKPDEIKYYYEWYDCIGFRLACGKSFEDMRIEFQEYVNVGNHSTYYQRILEILSFMEMNYSTDAWVKIGKDN